MMLPEPRLARQIIETLGQSGTPLSRGVSFYNAGNESLLNAIDTHYLGSYLADGGAVFKLVVGDYGSGKSHFLYCVRDRAWQRDFAVSKVDLSPKESPYDDQRRVYGAVASALVWHELGGTSEDELGLARFLEGTLRRLLAPLGLEPQDEGAAETPEVRAFLQTLEATPIDSLSFHKAIQGYFQALLRGQERRLETLERWLHGEEVTPEDMRDLRTIGVTEKINKNNAFKMLRSLCQTVRVLGYTGLVLLFDEGDRMLSIGGRAEKTATDNLREVIDRTREDLPGALFMYAVPPDFLNTVVPKYPALQQRVQTAGYFSRANPFSPQIDLEHLDLPDEQLLEAIGYRLMPIFEIAYGITLNHDLQTQNVHILAEAASNSYLAVSHRRLFVKALVTEWYRQKESGEQVINPEFAAALIKGQSDALSLLADDQQNPYEESPVEPQQVYHPHFGTGTLLKTYMRGYEWEVQFDSGRRFRLPAKEFTNGSAPLGPGEAPPLQVGPRVAVLEMDQFRAQQTLEALRVGIVPVQDAETLTIGLEAERVTLDRALSRSRERGGDVLAVIGDYGFGKSHFIELAARGALHENLIVASCSLDLVEVPPSKAHKIYEALTTSLRYPDGEERGLLPLISKALATPGVVERFVAACPREPQADPLAAALLALQDCPSQSAFEATVQWLGGQIRPQAAMKTCLKRPPRLYLTGENARQYSYMLTGLSSLAKLLGYGGLAVLIDEFEHYSLLRAAQRERADSFFKAMIVSALGTNNGRVDPRSIPDHTRVDYPISYDSEPHLFFLFALTESADRMPVGSWLTPSQLVRLDDRFIEKDVREFFGTLLRYHALAYGYVQERAHYEEVVAQAPGVLSRALAQHRINLRGLIRTAVTLCDLLYLYPDYQPETLLEELQSGLKV